ncbi:MAG: PEP-CTERM sorting domain-containing protein [Burkholderiaceae bacterium]
MNKTLAIMLLAASALLGPAPAAALPYTLYEFQVLSRECRYIQGGIADMMHCDRATYGLDNLNGLRVGLSANEGSLAVFTDWLFDPVAPYKEYSNANVAYTNFDKIGTEVDLDAGLCYGPYFCRVESAFRVDEDLNMLTGSLFTLTANDMFDMASGPSAIWSGYYGSDTIMAAQLHFTGVWRSEIPEPTTLALFGAGLLGVIGMRRRKIGTEPRGPGLQHGKVSGNPTRLLIQS